MIARIKHLLMCIVSMCIVLVSCSDPKKDCLEKNIAEACTTACNNGDAEACLKACEKDDINACTKACNNKDDEACERVIDKCLKRGDAKACGRICLDNALNGYLKWMDSKQNNDLKCKDCRRACQTGCEKSNDFEVCSRGCYMHNILSACDKACELKPNSPPCNWM